MISVLTAWISARKCFTTPGTRLRTASLLQQPTTSSSSTKLFERSPPPDCFVLFVCFCFSLDLFLPLVPVFPSCSSFFSLFVNTISIVFLPRRKRKRKKKKKSLTGQANKLLHKLLDDPVNLLVLPALKKTSLPFFEWAEVFLGNILNQVVLKRSEGPLVKSPGNISKEASKGDQEDGEIELACGEQPSRDLVQISGVGKRGEEK